MHLDIKGFFMSLKKDILFNLISKQVKNPEFLWLAKVIVFNDPLSDFIIKSDKSLFDKIPHHKSLFYVPKNQGLPIGNLTSQFFANVYLNELDQFAKHYLRTKYYIRYVDDFLILSTDKNQLKEWRSQIIYFLKQHLELNLNLQKQIIQTNDKGINWLGYIVKPTHILIRRRIVKALKNKLFLFNQILENYLRQSGQNEPPLELMQKILAVINSYFGHFKHANTFKLKKHLWDNHFKRLKTYFEPKDNRFSSIKIKSDFLKRAKRARKQSFSFPGGRSECS